MIKKIEGEKEQEMQIENPMDVKHVAHIGFGMDRLKMPLHLAEYYSTLFLSSSQVLPFFKFNVLYIHITRKDFWKI